MENFNTFSLAEIVTLSSPLPLIIGGTQTQQLKMGAVCHWLAIPSHHHHSGQSILNKRSEAFLCRSLGAFHLQVGVYVRIPAILL